MVEHNRPGEHHATPRPLDRAHVERAPEDDLQLIELDGLDGGIRTSFLSADEAAEPYER